MKHRRRGRQMDERSRHFLADRGIRGRGGTSVFAIRKTPGRSVFTGRPTKNEWLRHERTPGQARGNLYKGIRQKKVQDRTPQEVDDAIISRIASLTKRDAKNHCALAWSKVES